MLRCGLRHSEAFQVHKDLFKTDSFTILIVSLGYANYSDEFAARTFFGERCVQIEADQCGHAGSKSEVCSQQMSRQSETGKRHVRCCISDQNQQRQSDQNQQRQRVSFQHVQRRAKGAVRREKKSGDDMHAGVNGGSGHQLLLINAAGSTARKRGL